MTLNLHNCEEKHQFLIESVNLDLKLKIRLAQLGIFHGNKIKKINTGPGGIVMVKVDKSCYSIDKNLAQKIRLRTKNG